MTDWYDGPRQGVADFRGIPHLWVSEWADFGGHGEAQDEEQSDEPSTDDIFGLYPLPNDLFLLLLEDWAIWTRAHDAWRHQGTDELLKFALREDRSRRRAIKAVMEPSLEAIKAESAAVRAHATFLGIRDFAWHPGPDQPTVEWSLLLAGFSATPAPPSLD